MIICMYVYLLMNIPLIISSSSAALYLCSSFIAINYIYENCFDSDENVKLQLKKY